MKLLDVDQISRGMVAGIFTGYLLIYGLRPSIPYPDVILDFFENKWVILILLVINYYVFQWDYRNGALFLLCIIALIFDYIVFTEKGIKKVIVTESHSENRFNDFEHLFVK